MSSSNLDQAAAILRSCQKVGVQELVLCAGARNAPFVAVLSSSFGAQFRIYSFFEERSAAFFALGRMLSTRRPVAVITTSGTAVAELLPATIEADYQGQPLVLITADRPVHYRGSGAPQAILQPGIFSHYVEKTWDVEGPWRDDLYWSFRRPIHINVCFDEPLWGTDWNPPPLNPVVAPMNGQTQNAKCVSMNVPEISEPLVIVGGLSANEAQSVFEIVKSWRRPVYAEGISQLRGCFGPFEIPEIAIPHLKIDSVVRIGSIPTLRFWRDLEKLSLPVLHFSNQRFSGLPRCQSVSPISSLTQLKEPRFHSWTATNEIERQKEALTALLEQFRQSEPGWLHQLSRHLPDKTRLFLGNSLPIREWDLAAWTACRAEIFSNRGANGIDGLISTFTGIAEPGLSNWAVVGDLSALYDLAAPWSIAQRDLIPDINLVIINNGGGKIFQRIFNHSLFQNIHNLNFVDWAHMWNFEYHRLGESDHFPSLGQSQPSGVPKLFEVVPSEKQTHDFWLAMKEL